MVSKAILWLPSHFMSWIWTSCCHFESVLGWLNPQTRSIESLAGTPGHLGPPCLKCPGTKGAIPAGSPGGRLSDTPQTSVVGTGLLRKFTENVRNKLPGICPLLKLNFQHFSCNSNTQRKSLPSQIPVPSKSPSLLQMKPHEGIVACVATITPSLTAPLGGGMRREPQPVEVFSKP